MANRGFGHRFGITVVPVSPTAIAARMDRLIQEAEDDERLAEYLADVKGRMDTSPMEEDRSPGRGGQAGGTGPDGEEPLHGRRHGVLERSFPFWGAHLHDIGEMADEEPAHLLRDGHQRGGDPGHAPGGDPGQGVQLPGGPDHPPPPERQRRAAVALRAFPYSLKDSGCQARLVGGQEPFELKKGTSPCAGSMTVMGSTCSAARAGRWTDPRPAALMSGSRPTLDAGKADVWLIHHVGGIYGNYKPVLRRPRAISASSSMTPTSRGVYSL